MGERLGSLWTEKALQIISIGILEGEREKVMDLGVLRESNRDAECPLSLIVDSNDKIM